MGLESLVFWQGLSSPTNKLNVVSLETFELVHYSHCTKFLIALLLGTRYIILNCI